MTGREELFTLPAMAGAKPRRLEQRAAGNGFRFSPDGKFVAYASRESGQPEVYVAAYPAFAPKRQVSNGGGGDDLQWRGDGRELFYKIRNGPAMSVDVRTGPVIEAGVPKELFRGVSAHFAAAADGKRFLVAVPVDTTPPPDEWMAVLNWNAELKQ
jgi:eukaryotic-like serine/threonine-protein kinase